MKNIFNKTGAQASPLAMSAVARKRLRDKFKLILSEHLYAAFQATYACKMLALQSILFAVLIFAADASAQTGGTFEITQSVVSNGGGESTNGNFGVTGTSGQNLAGTNSSSGNFVVRGGFWQAFFAPTAALVSVSGQVLTAGNQPIGKARVTLTEANGLTRIARTTAFGYFRFDDVEVGQTCIFSVQSKSYHFANGTQVLFIVDEISDIVFIGSE